MNMYAQHALESVQYDIEEEDDDDDDGYFGQEQVPLSDEIREIMDEYPDGQIFKVQIILQCAYYLINIILCFITITFGQN